jgi:hypothetical protein
MESERVAIGFRARALLALVVALVSLGLMASGASAASMTTDCSGLQAALDQAVNGDTITLNQLCTKSNSGGHFDLSPAAHQQSYTLVGAPGSGAGFDGTSVGDRVLIGDNAPLGNTDTLTLRNLIFQNSSSGDGHGGGAIVFGGDYSVTLDHDTFTNNQTTDGTSGGAVEFQTAAANDSLTVTDSTFSGNTTQSSGGALDVFPLGGSIPVTLTGNVFANNTVDGCGGACELDGGGFAIINFNSPTAAVTQSGNTFTGNRIINGTASVEGGGEAVIGETLSSTNDAFNSNSIQAPVSPNVSNGSALALASNDCSSSLQSSAINLAVAGNSIADGDAAGAHGAVSTFCEGGTGIAGANQLTLTNSTISGNKGGGGTGGLWGEDLDQGTLQNSILNGNSDGGDLGGFAGGTVTATYTNLCNGTSPFTGTGNICADPKLVNASSGDVHETFSSPTVDAGSNALVPNGLTTDVYGNTRIQAKLAGGTATVDMGAAELNTVPAPTASITTPASGATYSVGQAVSSSFSCTEGAGGPGISSCVDQNGHASGGSVDTSTAGPHTFTVTATSSDGLTGTANVSYTVTATPPTPKPPSVSITTPRLGARYKFAQRVLARFSCREGTGGPGLSSCVGTVRNGSPIDTSTPGAHTFTVKAKSSDGQSATRSVRYTVLRPTNKLVKQPHLKPHSDGRFIVTVKVPHPGRVDILVTAWKDNFATFAAVRPPKPVLLQPAIGRFVFARAHAIAKRATTLHILVTPNARGRLLVAHHRYRVTLRLWVSYTPVGGHPGKIGYYGLHLP